MNELEQWLAAFTHPVPGAKDVSTKDAFFAFRNWLPVEKRKDWDKATFLQSLGDRVRYEGEGGHRRGYLAGCSWSPTSAAVGSTDDLGPVRYPQYAKIQEWFRSATLNDPKMPCQTHIDVEDIRQRYAATLPLEERGAVTSDMIFYCLHYTVPHEKLWDLQAECRAKLDHREPLDEETLVVLKRFIQWYNPRLTERYGWWVNDPPERVGRIWRDVVVVVAVILFGLSLAGGTVALFR